MIRKSFAFACIVDQVHILEVAKKLVLQGKLICISNLINWFLKSCCDVFVRPLIELALHNPPLFVCSTVCLIVSIRNDLSHIMPLILSMPNFNKKSLQTLRTQTVEYLKWTWHYQVWDIQQFVPDEILVENWYTCDIWLLYYKILFC